MKRVCVFCGSSPGGDPAFAEGARALGAEIAGRGLELVYGGGSVGLMGVLADAALASGAHVIGVVPRALAEREVAHRGLPDLRVVESMHERKALMAELADAFVALPGGLGTLEELFEVWTWGQLGHHAKPVALLDAGGFFADLTRFIDGLVERRFVRPEHRSMLLVRADAGELLDAMGGYVAPSVAKWIDADER